MKKTDIERTAHIMLAQWGSTELAKDEALWQAAELLLADKQQEFLAMKEVVKAIETVAPLTQIGNA